METPEERKAQASQTTMNETDNPAPNNMDPVSYVLIPADTSQPLQEFSFAPPSEVGGDALATHLKPAFAGNSDDVDLSLLLEQNQHLLAGSDGVTPVVSEDTMKQVAKQGHVEVFSLVHATTSNNMVAINLYLDEVGMLKRLKLNTRASEFAKQAGYNPPPTFYGNVFLGRVQKFHGQYNVMEHLNFELGKDTSPDAEWLKQAATDNLEKQLQMNQITGQSSQQPNVDGSDGVVKDEVGYAWTQTEEELELVVPLPSADAKSKDVQVKFKPQSVVVTFGGQKELLLDLELFERIDVDSGTWTMDRKNNNVNLVATMEKVEQALWPRVRL